MNILLTGANRGLGLQLLQEAVSRGYYVYATVRDEQGKNSVEEQLAAEFKHQVSYFILDVREEQKIADLAKQLLEKQIKLDVIINSAAVLLARQTAITDLDFKHMQDSFEINLFGAMYIVKHCLPLLKQDGAKILNISSEAGSITNAYAGDYPYSLSKCALNLFSEQLSRTLKKDHIDVWSIHPGWMKTDMGGQNAALEPSESAQSIINIADGKTEVKSTQSFINYKGEPMAI